MNAGIILVYQKKYKSYKKIFCLNGQAILNGKFLNVMNVYMFIVIYDK